MRTEFCRKCNERLGDISGTSLKGGSIHDVSLSFGTRLASLITNHLKIDQPFSYIGVRIYNTESIQQLVSPVPHLSYLSAGKAVKLRLSLL